MPFIVENLIPESQKLVTVTAEKSAKDALDLMLENDFSQLPVIASDKTLRGLITSKSLLQAINYCGVTPDKLKVSHALIKVKPCTNEDDLSELLNGLRDNSAIPVVDRANCVVAILTSFDTTEYFRQRAEDIMLAEDIEITLRDLIEDAYKTDQGDTDKAALKEAVNAITPSGRELQGRFKQALKHYLTQIGSKEASEQEDFQDISLSKKQTVHIESTFADKAFEKCLYQPIQPKDFEKLTLNDFILLFKNIWKTYAESFQHIEWDATSKLLNEVREIRNAIAHFREIKPHQHEQLKYCANFLNQHRPSLKDSVMQVGVDHNIIVGSNNAIIHHHFFDATAKSQASSESDIDVEQDSQPPVEEEIDSTESRYAPLAVWLQRVDNEYGKINLTFEEIEEIIGGELPTSARRHRNWWANDTVSHSQSQQWLDVDWRVSNVNISEERVVFSRISERQSAYIEFFNQLADQLRQYTKLKIEIATNPQGRHWLGFNISKLDSSYKLWLVFSFARRRRFRLEHYIDYGDQQCNKLVFDELISHKAEIETELEAPLSWERLSDKRASRIAIYRQNIAITDEPIALKELQSWAMDIVGKFYWAIGPRHAQIASDMPRRDSKQP